MDKAEYRIKLEQINNLAENGDFKGAAAIADTIESASSCGVCGVVFGRNVWQSEDPARMVQALKAITYRGDREEFLRLCK